MTATPLTSGRNWWVPHNRWDLIESSTLAVEPTSCAIIVPYFQQPQSLQRMYGALQVADLDPGRYEVIVVDDGSDAASSPPTPPAGLGLTVTQLWQPDRGCRPGAARDLGARNTSAECLVFLDADTLPDANCIRHLARWPTVMPDALVVGRRRHAVLDGWNADRTRAWLDGSGPAPEERRDPEWLSDAYRRTGNLLDSDDRSYRFVISGVMACHRSAYLDAGGFDVDRDRYGAEDWDLAARMFNTGAVLLHDPDAVAWHDEPDWSERTGNVAEQNDQAVWLAGRVADPAARGHGVIHEYGDTIVRFDEHFADWEPSVAIASIESLLCAKPDATIFLPSCTPAAVRRYVGHDPRVRFGVPEERDRVRARTSIDVFAPADWSAHILDDLLGRVAPGGVGVVEVVSDGEPIAVVASTRALGRVRRATDLGLDAGDAMQTLFGREQQNIDLAPWPTSASIDLAAWFDRRNRLVADPR